MDLHHAHPTPASAESRSRPIGRVIAGLVVMLVAIFGSTASAGGWAVSTLDAMPEPTPGESVDVGFTIRQHGVTPVDIDHGVGIEITSADGTVRVFPAAQQGATGHYVATVVFPAAGDYTWAVHQGSFARQELGALTVAGSDSAASNYRFPAIARYGLPALAMVFAAASIADVVVRRHRRRAVVA